jgi:hypothetical protein
MTKPRLKWPGELGTVICRLPASSLMHGGRVTSDKVSDYNLRAIESIDSAIHNERLKKLILLADYYGVGKQNYAGIAKALAAQFEPRFKGNIYDLRKIYGVSVNKTLAIKMGVKYCKGFGYKRPEFKTEAGVIGRDGADLAIGGIRPMLARGRVEEWDADQYSDLLNDLEKYKKPELSETKTIQTLRRHNSRWHKYTVANLKSRLQDAKRLKKSKLI